MLTDKYPNVDHNSPAFMLSQRSSPTGLSMDPSEVSRRTQGAPPSDDAGREPTNHSESVTAIEILIPFDAAIQPMYRKQQENILLPGA